MKHFALRVVLRQNASLADYETLHARMEARFLYRKILSADGVWYDLPPAEYQCISEGGTIESVREQAAQIAREIDPSVRVRVTEGLSAWVGLERSAFQGGPTLQSPSTVFDYLRTPSPFPPADYRPAVGTLLTGLIAPPPAYR